MKRHPVLGAVSILAAVLPGWVALASVLGFGALPTYWMVLQHGVPALVALIAGALLIFGQKSARTWALFAWVLLLILASFNLAITWWSFAPGSQFPPEIVIVELIYLFGSTAMLWSIAKGGTNAAAT